GLGEQQRQHRKSLLALRAEGTELAGAGENLDVVEVRPGAGDAAIEIAVEATLEQLYGRRVGFVAKRGVHQPQLAGAGREQRLERSDHIASRCNELGSEVGDTLGPGPQRLARAVTERDTAKRRVSLNERGAVFSRQRGLRRRAATERSVEIRPPRRG